MKTATSNALLKNYMNKSGFTRMNENFEQLMTVMKQITYLPIIVYEDLLFLLLGIYQLKMARSYLLECHERLKVHTYII